MNPKLLYHITDYHNLFSIIESGGLSAYAKVFNDQISHEDIAHPHIQSRRSTTKVEISPYGFLHDYVPFYFAPRSPMLYAIKSGKVEGYNGVQNDIIYLVTNTKNIAEAGKKFVFTDGHAIMKLTEFYNDLVYLKEIDWAVMEGKYWQDTDQYPDRKRKRQAEFLVHDFVPLELFLGIGVQNEQTKAAVLEILNELQTDMDVLIKPSFYF